MKGKAANSISDACLDIAQITLRITSGIVDGIYAPGVGGIVEAVSVILDLVQTMRYNRGEHVALLDQITQYLRILQGNMSFEKSHLNSNQKPTSNGIENQVIQFQRILSDIQNKLNDISHRKPVSRVLCAYSDKRKILECKDKIATELQTFILESQMTQERYRQRIEQEAEYLKHRICSLEDQLESVKTEIIDAMYPALLRVIQPFESALFLWRTNATAQCFYQGCNSVLNTSSFTS